MIEVALLGIAIWHGVDLRRLMVLGAVVVFPIPVALMLAVHWWRSRTSPASGAARFCEAVSAEMRAGASPGHAIAAGARSVGALDLAEAAEAGESPAGVARVARREFPEVAPELAVCIERASWSGSPSADLFDEVASVALAELDAAREIRAAMAPARATVLVLVSGPIVAFWWVLRSGDLEMYLGSHTQQAAVALGGALCLGAVVVGILMMRRYR